METKGSMQASLSIWLLVVGLLSQNLLAPVLCAPLSFEDQKNYYTPDPHAGSPPTGSHGTPVSPTPYHGTPTPHGHKTPPTGKCDSTPPKSHKSPPTHSGSSPHTPTPYTPRGGSPPKTPTPSTPRGGGGGYSPSPPTSGGSPPVVSPPTTPVPDPGTPYVPTPETPDTPTPTPTTPGAPPFLPDPNTPCTCDYWKHHPALVWGVVGWFGLGSLGGAFGHSSLPGISPSLTCLDALSNTIPTGYGALYREGTAALLNAVATHNFPYSTQDVREHFASGLGSNSAAASQAQLFKMANEGKYKSKA